jgi:hypothetical protein
MTSIYSKNILASTISIFKGIFFFSLNPDKLSLNTYMYFNNTVAWLHLLQFFTLLGLYVSKLKNVKPDLIFVSGELKLLQSNHMLHVIGNNIDNSPCQEARDFMTKYPDKMVTMPPIVIKGAANSVLLDFTNTQMVYYNQEYSISTPIMIMCFFILSWAFQILNGIYLRTYNTGPYFLQYVEYSISASLTIVIMAVNVGIQDLLTIIMIFALFFGMNIFGAVAEIMMHMAENAGGKNHEMYIFDLRTMWIIPHVSGWVLFFFAWTPIIIKFTKTSMCVDPAVPSFITAAVAMESFFYFSFGILQLAILIMRTLILYRPNAKDTAETTKEIKNYLNWGTVILSFFAKTFLAWILMGPVWAADTSNHQA